MPASVVVLSGDVHHAYLAEVAFPADSATGRRSDRRGRGGRWRAERPVYQAVCSPYRNPLDAKEQRVIRGRIRPPLHRASPERSRGGRSAPDPEIRWRAVEGPYFDNQVAMMRIDGRRLEMRLDKTIPGDEDESALRPVLPSTASPETPPSSAPQTTRRRFVPGAADLLGAMTTKGLQRRWTPVA